MRITPFSPVPKLIFPFQFPGLDADQSTGLTFVFVAVDFHVSLHYVLGYEHLVTNGAGE